MDRIMSQHCCPLPCQGHILQGTETSPPSQSSSGDSWGTAHIPWPCRAQAQHFFTPVHPTRQSSERSWPRFAAPAPPDTAWACCGTTTWLNQHDTTALPKVWQPGRPGKSCQEPVPLERSSDPPCSSPTRLSTAVLTQSCSSPWRVCHLRDGGEARWSSWQPVPGSPCLAARTYPRCGSRRRLPLCRSCCLARPRSPRRSGSRGGSRSPRRGEA